MVLIDLFSLHRILPQAFGKRIRFSLAYYFSFLTYAIMGILFVASYPISKLFELLIGHEEQTYFKRSELKELFDQHGKAGMSTLSRFARVLIHS
jgi:hypothetical protein